MLLLASILALVAVVLAIVVAGLASIAKTMFPPSPDDDDLRDHDDLSDPYYFPDDRGAG